MVMPEGRRDVEGAEAEALLSVDDDDAVAPALLLGKHRKHWKAGVLAVSVVALLGSAAFLYVRGTPPPAAIVSPPARRPVAVVAKDADLVQRWSLPSVSWSVSKFGLFQEVGSFFKTGQQIVQFALPKVQGAAEGAVGQLEGAVGKLEPLSQVLSQVGGYCGDALSYASLAPPQAKGALGVCAAVGIGGSMVIDACAKEGGGGGSAEDVLGNMQQGFHNGFRRLEDGVRRSVSQTAESLDTLNQKEDEELEQLDNIRDQLADLSADNAEIKAKLDDMTDEITGAISASTVEIKATVVESTKEVLEGLKDVKGTVLREAAALASDIGALKDAVVALRDDIFRNEMYKITDKADIIAKMYKVTMTRLLNTPRLTLALLNVMSESKMLEYETLFDAKRFERIVIKHVEMGHPWSEVQMMAKVFLTARVYLLFLRSVFCTANGLGSEFPDHANTAQADLQHFSWMMYEWCPTTNCPTELAKVPRGCFQQNSTSPCWAFASGLSSRITGDLSDIPKTVEIINFTDNTHISGNFKDLPEIVRYIDLPQASRVSGDIGDLPISMLIVDVRSSTQIKGDVKALPRQAQVAIFGASELTGAEADLPCSLQSFSTKSRLTISHNCVTTCNSLVCPAGMTLLPGTTVGNSWEECCVSSCYEHKCPSGMRKNGVAHGKDWMACCEDDPTGVYWNGNYWYKSHVEGHSCDQVCQNVSKTCHESAHWPKDESRGKEIFRAFSMDSVCERWTSSQYGGSPKLIHGGRWCFTHDQSGVTSSRCSFSCNSDENIRLCPCSETF